MKKYILLCFMIGALTVQGQDLKKTEFSVAIGYMFEGEMYAAEIDQYFSVGETILIKGEFNYYVADKFGLGPYYTLGFPYYSYFYEEVTMHEIGLVFKGRFVASDKLTIKPGLYTGFRAYTGGLDIGTEPGTGFGLNATAAFQYNLNDKVKPFIDLGIMTQPAGGNDESDITYGPTFQMSFGITF